MYLIGRFHLICNRGIKHYKNINVVIGNKKLDITSAIKKSTSYDLIPIEHDNKIYDVKLEIIEWNKNKERKLYLCTEAGFPSLPITNKKFQMHDYSFSAYLKTPYVDKLVDEGIVM